MEESYASHNRAALWQMVEHGWNIRRGPCNNAQDLAGRALLFQCLRKVLLRLVQVASMQVELFLLVGGRGTGTPRGRGRVAALRTRRLAVRCFCGFPAYCATSCHVALRWQTTLAYHTVRALVQHSKD
jgi:hypothetical protein